MTQEFSFKTFSDQGFYQIVNKRVVDLADLKSGQRIIDLACGTGGVTRLILESLREACDSVVIGIDHSATALKQAMKDLGEFKDATVQLVQSRIELISDVIRDSVDTVILCNAIHYIPDKQALLSEISKTLRPGGSFVFNTSFFDGAHQPGSETFYRRWMMKAIRGLHNDHKLRPNKEQKVEARKPLTPEDYKDLLAENGFKIKSKNVHTVEVPIQGWVTISQFEDFIAGALPGVPLDKASSSLINAVKDTFEELSLTVVPRNWLEVVAVKV